MNQLIHTTNTDGTINFNPVVDSQTTIEGLSGTITLNNGGYGGSSSNCITVPNNTWMYQTNYQPTPYYYIQLRKVENGWVLLKGNKEYIITKPDQILKYLENDKDSK